MAIQDIRLQNFRGYNDESFEVEPGVTIIVGPNASGKTTLLEAILFSCLGSSYRVKDAELVQFDQPWARVDVGHDEQKRTVKLERQPSGVVKKQFVIQDQNLTRLSLQKTIPVVLFEPDHLLLLSGSPDLRRDYMDDLLEQTVSGFSVLRRQYKRTLAQRNRLLKLDGARDQVFAWNIRLSQLGGQIAVHRMALVSQISHRFEAIYHALSDSATEVGVVYSSKCLSDQYSSDMLHKLEQTIDQDIARGFTTVGPHRDDLTISIHDHPLQEVASRGEVRTLLLSLKIVEIEVLTEARGKKPVLLLDDVFSELDGARRKALTTVLSDYQTFITTTDADVVVDHFLGNCSIIPLGS